MESSCSLNHYIQESSDFGDLVAKYHQKQVSLGGGLTLAEQQVPTKATVSLPSQLDGRKEI